MTTLDNDRLYQQGLNAGLVEMFVMLVREMDIQGAIDKDLFLKRIFTALTDLESRTEGMVSERERGLIDQLRGVARPLDRQ